MKTLLYLVLFVCAASQLMAAERGIFGLYGDTPDAKHAWAVHDFNRPYPKQVETPAGKPPSDAIVLFDGTQKSVDENWCDDRGNPTKWRVKDGLFVCVPRSGMACTKRAFGDAQLHVEWMSPVADAQKHGQLGGNSGVFPMGMYEIQILNSYDPDPNADVTRNYPDGIAGSAYAENPPLVNASRPAGEWQSYDIVFHQPIWDGTNLVHAGTITVFHNGVLVQDAWELEGMSTHRVRRPLVPHPTKLPWKLQDHGDPVPFRNIWIREIPSRWANTTHSVMSAKEEDVRALREQIAAKLFAQIDPAKPDVRNVNAILEVLSYSKLPKYTEAAKTLCAGYEATLKSLPEKELDAVRNYVTGTLKGFDVLLRNQVIAPADYSLYSTLQGIVRKKKW
ncbi:MAG: DUF1080 domain-containing protein [Kiritimatiellae bacterium]|nr:DUF1080 domain-containing protein [Kiritimatiellia bacterium]